MTPQKVKQMQTTQRISETRKILQDIPTHAGTTYIFDEIERALDMLGQPAEDAKETALLKYNQLARYILSTELSDWERDQFKDCLKRGEEALKVEVVSKG